MSRRDRNVTPGRTVANGYGAAHKRERLRWVPIVAAGGVKCARGAACLRAHLPNGRLIHPDEPWDLGHDDHDKSKYRGPEHRACNRRAGLLKGQGRLQPDGPKRVVRMVGW